MKLSGKNRITLVILNHIVKQPEQIFCSIVLGGIFLCLSTGITLPKKVLATPKQTTILAANLFKLPSAVAHAVLRKTSEVSGLPISNLRIVQSRKRTWSNGCLGLSEPGVVCTQALIPGWRVSVESAKQRWDYRTNNSGSVVKLEGTLLLLAAYFFPPAVATAVLEDASQFTAIPLSQLKIVLVEKRTWSDGCLGLAEEAGILCTQALTPGWRVVVEGEQARLEYRTNETGSLIKLESAIR